MINTNKPKQLKTRINQIKKIRISEPKIDKLAFIKKYTDETEFNKAKRILLSEDLENFVKIIKNGKVDKTEIRFKSRKKYDKYYFLNIDIYSFENKMRFEYNPSKVDRNDLSQISYKTFNMNKFEDLMINSKFTRTDLCKDILGADIEDYFFRVKRMRKHVTFETNDNGHIETLCYGGTSSNQFCIYNKTKEQKLNDILYPKTRIEYRKRESNFYASDLLDIKNPFPQVEIYGLNLPNNILDAIPQDCFILFMDCCRLRGVANALKTMGLDKKVKEKTLRQLGKYALPIWTASHRGWNEQWINALKEAHIYEAVLASQNRTPLVA